MPKSLVLILLAFVGLSGLSAQASASVSPASASASCKSPSVWTADGCRRPAAARADISRIIQEVKETNHLQGVIARVDLKGRTLLRKGFGESQSGVPATPRQHFRIGSMVIPALTSLAFQLQDRGRLKITDKISRWVPEIPRSEQVTIEMLMNNTSGYVDWVQGNEDFVDELYKNPFRTWKENELLRIALGRGYACDPGECFHYAHTNYLILGKLLRKATGKATATLLQRRMFKPLGMKKVGLSPLAPIPGPVLNSYSVERGFFENTTGWSPSWSLGNGMIATSTIDDVIRGAQGVLSGRLLSGSSRRQLFRKVAPAPDGAPAGTYFAQGLIVTNGWHFQNPYINGYMGNMAWLPKRRLAIALVSTRSDRTTDMDGRNFTNDILAEIARYLSPAQIPNH